MTRFVWNIFPVLFVLSPCYVSSQQISNGTQSPNIHTQDGNVNVKNEVLQLGGNNSQNIFPGPGSTTIIGRHQEIQTKAVREQLGRFLIEGNALANNIRKGPPFPLPEKEATDWYIGVQKYLQANLDSSYGARFVATEPSLPITYGIPKEYESLFVGINQRLSVLRRFLEEMRD